MPPSGPPRAPIAKTWSMPGQREDLVGLFDHVWDRFWRRMDGLDDEEWRWRQPPTRGERNGAWLGRPAEPTGLAGRKAAGAAASLAGYFADATGRSFVLHIADELI